MSGITFVTLPIGNPEDITLKAIRLLKESSIIYCEDTRVFKEMAKRLSIELTNKKIQSFHDHSGESKLSKVLSDSNAEGVVFVSDAGSPLISDPAFPLLREALEQNIEIKTASGISSVTASLELSGLPPIPFHFHGFLSRDSGKIAQQLEQMAAVYGTHIFFEGKSRILDTLKKLSKLYPESDICVCREMTKDFESIYRFKGKNFPKKEHELTIKGEFVVLIYISDKSTQLISKEIKALAESILVKGTKPKIVAKLLSQITGESTSSIYDKLKNDRQ